MPWVPEIYRRIEALPPHGDLQRGFAAEVADPLWLLTRQWRMGEHLAEDAGSPVVVSVTATHAPLAPVAGLDPTVIPAEAIIEGAREDWWTVGRRVRVGREIAPALSATERAAAAFTTRLPAPYDDAFAGEVDGLAAWRLALIPATHWVHAAVEQAVGGTDRRDAWRPETLDHGHTFEVAGAALRVDGHGGGEVDWYTVDGEEADDPRATVPTPARQTREVIPMRLQYPGAPHPRFWQIEDHAVDIGGYPPDRAHLATALLIELIADHANDWFLVPIPGPLPPSLTLRRSDADPPGVGVLVTLDEVTVTDTFDESWTVTPPTDWSLFKTAGLHPSALVILPAATTPLAGPVLDDVVLGVDEDANVLWAVEVRVGGVDLLDDAASAEALADGRRTGTRAFTWLPATTLPEHWHPYRIEAVPDGASGTRRAFVQGLAATATGPSAVPGVRRGPRSELIGGTPDDAFGSGHTLAAHAVPNQGLRLERRYLLARGTDGRPALWRERRRVPLLAGPVSHLRFDVFREEPATDDT
jgi:hypothetical protein